MFSADGKWVAYDSDESGRAEIYVVPFPGSGGKWQISTGGGTIPFWPPGHELFYLTVDSRMVGVEYTVEGTNFKVGKSRLLFGGRSLASIPGNDINFVDKRWLLALTVAEPNISPLILVTNWTKLLNK
jgi:hypothetical protein